MPAEGARRAAVWRGGQWRGEKGGAARAAGEGGGCAARLGREGRGLGFWRWEADYIWQRVGGLQVGRRWDVVGQNFFAESPTIRLSAKR
jgi:hypothetical protein